MVSLDSGVNQDSGFFVAEVGAVATRAATERDEFQARCASQVLAIQLNGQVFGLVKDTASVFFDKISGDVLTRHVDVYRVEEPGHVVELTN
jgi:hypothetical protein